MDLFRHQSDPPENILPHDGTVTYYGEVLPPEQADSCFAWLREAIEWKHDEAVIYGKRIITKRKVAWYADQQFEYSYSGTTKLALPWTEDLLKLKSLVEHKTGETFNSCLLNLYHDGSEGMAWHSDAEKDLKKNGAIGSLSFGAERRFSFKHKKTKETVTLMLEHGSLLVMSGTTQTFWQHRLPPMKRIDSARINLTFRTIESSKQR